jgi:hypothetical protein
MPTIRKTDTETIERLRAMWNEGMSINQIARAAQLTRNQVAGLAHRNGFPKRTSFFVPGGSRAERPKPVPNEKEARLALLPLPVGAFPFGGGCRWIDGEPNVMARMCGSPRAEGHPYCEPHLRRAWKARA